MKLRNKTLLLTLMIGVVPMIIAATMGYKTAASSLREEAFNKLMAIHEAKKSQLEAYMNVIMQQIISFSNNEMILGAHKEFSSAFMNYIEDKKLSSQVITSYSNKVESYYTQEFGSKYREINKQAPDLASMLKLDERGVALQYTYIAANSFPLGSKDELIASQDDSSYDNAHNKYHPYIRDFLKRFEYYDIFLVDAETGYIVYTVFKELDFATNLKTGPYANSGIGEVFRQALTKKQGEIALVDFDPYYPSYNAPASFIATPIIDQGKMLGVLIFQIPINRINGTLSQRSGLGDTGEVYLVGSDGLMRTDSRFETESTILRKHVDTLGVKQAIAGNKGRAVLDNAQGVEVLSVYEPFNFGSETWALMAEINAEEAFSYANNLAKSLGLLTVVVVALIFIIGWLVAKRFTKPILNAVDFAKHISSGNLDAEIDANSRDEIGEMISNLQTMRGNLKERIERDFRSAAENARIKQALDNVTAKVMMVDADNNIIYLNQAVAKMLRDAEADIRKDLPHFSANKLMGSNIDIFHKDPKHQRRILENLRDTYNSGFVLGGHIIKISATPVMNEAGERLGVVVEWQDRTMEVGIETEVEKIIQAAQSGDLSQRISLEGKQGFLHNLSQGVNQLLNIISETFEDIGQVMNAMANGDLTRTIEREYQGVFGEVKDNINQTLVKLEETVSEIRESADVMTTAAEEILTGNNNLSSRTEQQAASLEETASSMEELTSTVKQNADNAQQADQLAASARQTAERGGKVVRDAVSAMVAINSASSKIAEIIGVIDEIAFQTNLLALNASVEAARAGEQGRGFAVVATEVRNLAQRSASAAKEIKELIQDSVGKVKAGSELVNESGNTLEEIVVAVKKVGDIVAEIASASREQSAGIDQVSQAVSNMDELTQQNAALAEQTSAASVSLSERSREMIKQMQFFNLSKAQPVNSSSTTSAKSANSSAMKKSFKPLAKKSIEKKPMNAPSQSQEDEWAEF